MMSIGTILYPTAPVFLKAILSPGVFIHLETQTITTHRTKGEKKRGEGQKEEFVQSL